MKHLFDLTMAFVAACLIMACSGNRVSEDQLRNEISTVPMLYTVEATVDVLVEGHGRDGTGEWKAVFGKRDIILPIKANVKVGIDLSQITAIEIKGDKVYLQLPDPVVQIESTEIPWTEVVANVTGMSQEFTAREKEFLTRKGKEKIMEQIPDMDLIAPAQQHAELVLSNLISSMGYTPVFKARPVYREFDFVRLIQD